MIESVNKVFLLKWFLENAHVITSISFTLY